MRVELSIELRGSSQLHKEKENLVTQVQNGATNSGINKYQQDSASTKNMFQHIRKRTTVHFIEYNYLAGNRLEERNDFAVRDPDGPVRSSIETGPKSW